MAATFSINDGQIIESTKKQDVFSVLKELPDNTKKLISPRDVRDAFFTTWASSPIKITTPGTSTTEYIGIDSSNPSDRDIKKSILLGKRSYGNLEVMSSSLLNTNNADIFIYNTKPDSYSQDSTKIAILSGTNSSLWYYAPYISASYSSISSSIDMNLVNPSPNGGDINILSSAGRVAINGVVFPTIAETSASASNGRILRYYGTYPNGYLKWDDATVTLSSIGSSTLPTNIYGSIVNVNGYPLEFVDDNLVPNNIGGISQGESFSPGTFNGIYGTQNWPLTEVVRKILYPYIEPVLTLSVNNPSTGTTYAEVGTTPSFVLSASATLYARDENEYISDFIISGTTFSQYSSTRNPLGFSFSGNPGSQLSFTVSGITYSSTITDLDYVYSVSNVWLPGFGGVTASSYPSFFSYSVTASVSFVAPFLLQIGNLDNTSFTTNATNLFTSSVTTRYVGPYPGVSKSVKIGAMGTGYLYFGYPSSYNTYGTLSTIKDVNGFIIHDVNSTNYSAFTYSYNVSSSGTTFTNYTIFRTLLPCGYTGSGEFEFTF